MPTLGEKIRDALQSQSADAEPKDSAPTEQAALEELKQVAEVATPKENAYASVPIVTSETSSGNEEVQLCNESQAKNQRQWAQQLGWRRKTHNAEENHRLGTPRGP